MTKIHRHSKCFIVRFSILRWYLNPPGCERVIPTVFLFGFRYGTSACNWTNRCRKMIVFRWYAKCCLKTFLSTFPLLFCYCKILPHCWCPQRGREDCGSGWSTLEKIKGGVFWRQAVTCETGVLWQHHHNISTKSTNQNLSQARTRRPILRPGDWEITALQ